MKKLGRKNPFLGVLSKILSEKFRKKFKYLEQSLFLVELQACSKQLFSCEVLKKLLRTVFLQYASAQLPVVHYLPQTWTH